MKITTTRFGEIEVNEDKIITFNEGLLGFEDIHRYILLENGPTFYWLQSVSRGDLALSCMLPSKVCDNYFPEIENDILDKLELKDDDNALILCVVVIPDDIKKTTVNLRAPIIINTENNKAVQVVLESNAYAIKHLVFTQ